MNEVRVLNRKRNPIVRARASYLRTGNTAVKSNEPDGCLWRGLGCAGSAAQDDETDTGGVSTSNASSGTAAFDCATQPTVVVWLPLNSGGLVSGEVDYSVAGGPRIAAEDCTQGACFIYEGAGQPIEVFARYQDCDESTLSITGAVCPDQSSAELFFGFYEGCTVPDGTDGPPGSGTGGNDTDTETETRGTRTGTGTGTGTDTKTGGETAGSTGTTTTG